MHEAKKKIARLFQSPLGFFPRGGLESSLKVKISSSPNWVKVVKGDLEMTISFQPSGWLVYQSGQDNEETYESLEEAVEALLVPFLRQEISRVFL
jgi:hypothetical protein